MENKFITLEMAIIDDDNLSLIFCAVKDFNIYKVLVPFKKP